MPRGTLTPEIQEKAVVFLGKPITTIELRLMPYLLHCLTNDKDLDRSHINEAERSVLSEWEEKGYIQYRPLKISKPFYDFANELIFISYIKGCERNLNATDQK